MRLFCLCLVCAIDTALMADEVELHAGDRLLGTVFEQTAESVHLDHPVLGRLVLDAALVRAVRRDSAAAAPWVPPGLPAPVDPAGVLAAEPLPAPKRRWDSRIEVGFGANEGTTEEANLRLAFTTALEEETQRYKFSAVYSLQTSRGDRSKNMFNAAVAAEWPQLGSRRSYFARRLRLR